MSTTPLTDEVAKSGSFFRMLDHAREQELLIAKLDSDAITNGGHFADLIEEKTALTNHRDALLAVLEKLESALQSHRNTRVSASLQAEIDSAKKGGKCSH